MASTAARRLAQAVRAYAPAAIAAPASTAGAAQRLRAALPAELRVKTNPARPFLYVEQAHDAFDDPSFGYDYEDASREAFLAAIAAQRADSPRHGYVRP